MNHETQHHFNSFYALTPNQRLKIMCHEISLGSADQKILQASRGRFFETLNYLSENVIASMPMPLSIAPHFLINNRNVLIPMVTEEPSVVAAASNGAKMARLCGGFTVNWSEPIIEGLIQIVDIPIIEKSIEKLEFYKAELLAYANDQDPILVSKDGGARDLIFKVIETSRGSMLIATLIVDVRDAMGANAVNGMVEDIAPLIAKITGGKVRIAIVSNFTPQRTATASAQWSRELLGKETIEAFLDVQIFACADIRRAATHNKGIMNGVEAVARATGNDTRALEAAAHSFAVRTGSYQPLSNYHQDAAGNLVGTLELPTPIGIVGGCTNIHPIARIARDIMQPASAQELGGIMAAVGLAQNFAALRALVCEGIQKGHMRLHKRACGELFT